MKTQIFAKASAFVSFIGLWYIDPLGVGYPHVYLLIVALVIGLSSRH